MKKGDLTTTFMCGSPSIALMYKAAKSYHFYDYYLNFIQECITCLAVCLLLGYKNCNPLAFCCFLSYENFLSLLAASDCNGGHCIDIHKL